jgi:hypothetical protein
MLNSNWLSTTGGCLAKSASRTYHGIFWGEMFLFHEYLLAFAEREELLYYRREPS